jgi:hypothetical protein
MEIVVVIFSAVFFVTIVRGAERVESESTVLVAVTIGTEPVGRIVEVIVTVSGVLVTENGAICRDVKSIHDVLEKKFPSSNAVASASVIWCEKVALEVLTAPGPVFWYSPKKTPAVFGVLVDH